MGLDQNGTQCILYAKRAGVDFSRTAQIGRQDLNLWPSELQRNLSRFGFPAEKAAIEKIFMQDIGFADELFRYLGAQSVESFDFSDYEGATHVHDMNKPIPAEFKSRYSLVVDSGTLEHVFNFPIAIKNCMEMVETGGYYLGITPANNFLGHGFYQFSPELIFGMFSAAQGFEVVCLIAYEDRPNAQWYRVSSPDSVQARITLRNGRPTYLFVIARRLAAVEPFQSEPYQCDYVSAWNRTQETVEERKKRRKGMLNASMTKRVWKSMERGINRFLGRGNAIERFDYVGFRSPLFNPINPAKDCITLGFVPSR